MSANRLCVNTYMELHMAMQVMISVVIIIAIVLILGDHVVQDQDHGLKAN